MGNTETKAQTAGAAKARRQSLSERIRSSTSRSGSKSSSSRAPTPGEEDLAHKLLRSPGGAVGPPFYAISSSWMAVWSAFALGGDDPPGPISNASLVGPTPASAEEVLWLSGEDWHVVHALYGGGPVLCRATQRLSLSVDRPIGEGSADSPGSPSNAGVDPGASIVLVQDAIHAHEKRCRQLEQDLAARVALFEKGVWAKKRSSLGFRKNAADDARAAARQRLSQAVTTKCGGEELRSALQSLRETGDADAPGVLDPMVADLCVHEEAQIVLACLLQALQDSDRVSLELWLEQADAMGLEALISDMPAIIGPLNKHLEDLQECERETLKQHEQAAELNNEGPSERMWRISMAAFEEKDEAMLSDLIYESRAHGLDVSAVEMLLEELVDQRAAKERRERPSWAYGADGKEPKDGAFKEPKDGARSRWGDPSTWATPGTGDWKDPSAWGNTEDFLDAWRKWKHQDRVRQYGAEEAERMRREEEESRQRWKESEEQNRRQAYFERERAQRDEEERNRKTQQQRWQHSYGYSTGGAGGSSSYSGYSAGYAGNSNYGSSAYSGSSYGGGYSRQQRAAPPARSSNSMDTGQALQVLGLPVGRVPPLGELKAAYKKAAMRAHPDRPHNRGRQAQATAEFQKVKAAFDQLSDAAPPG